MKKHVAAAVTIFAVAASLGAAGAVRWGYEGHEMSGRAAALNAPKDMPEFFRKSVDQLTYLNPEPDRWRAPDSLSREMNEATSSDHFIDMEALPKGAFEARDRWDFWARAQAGGVKRVRDAGFAYYAVLEHYQRLEHEFQLYRNEKNDDRREFIEQRIINEAGILGHYVTDLSNPLHTTVHYDRWVEPYPNPNGYTTARGFHSRFESAFVKANIRADEVHARTRKDARRLNDVRAELLAYVTASNALVEQLYALDKAEAFGPETKSPRHKDFALGRLATGADMLRDLWWTAWVKSGEPGAH